MKRLIPILLIATWILFNSSGKKSEWYFKVYDQETIIRVPRDQYLEFYDLLYENKPGELNQYAQHVLLNESKIHTENEAGRNIEIQGPDLKTLIEIHEKYVAKKRNEFLKRFKSYPELWN